MKILNKVEPSTTKLFPYNSPTTPSPQLKQNELLPKEEPDLINLDSKNNSPVLKDKKNVPVPSEEQRPSEGEVCSPPIVLSPSPEESLDNLSRDSVNSLNSYVHPNRKSETNEDDDMFPADYSSDETGERDFIPNEELVYETNLGVEIISHDFISRKVDTTTTSSHLQTRTHVKSDNLSNNSIKSNDSQIHSINGEEMAVGNSLIISPSIESSESDNLKNTSKNLNMSEEMSGKISLDTFNKLSNKEICEENKSFLQKNLVSN